ncbi:MAG: MBL fold metallo-hydrolase RNA specificity domain-containing protein [Chthoniobacter sp.]
MSAIPPTMFAGKVLVCPPSANRTLMLTRIKKPARGRAHRLGARSGATYRYQCDAAFPLSDHADYTDLVRYVELVQPQHVLTLHGFAGAFAADLRERGFEAWALSEENQLELSLRRPPAAPRPPAHGGAPAKRSGDPSSGLLRRSASKSPGRRAS